MATETLLEKKLVLSFSEGMDEDGKDIIKRYTYSNILQTATSDSLFSAAMALSTLFNGTAQEFGTVDNNILTQN
ncbi:hypothetical protein CJ195_22375 [Bacillus sp. UMB0899]|nr:hypothetical protein CJ195_22375 [Bacillus sp. UMB0899]